MIGFLPRALLLENLAVGGDEIRALGYSYVFWP
jgi:hypothetical protein